MSDINKKETNKLLCAIAYIGILFIVPFLVDKENEDYLFHANQGLILFAANIAFTIATNVISGILMAIAPILGLFMGAVYIIPLIFVIIGVKNALESKRERLPLIGDFDILK